METKLRRGKNTKGEELSASPSASSFATLPPPSKKSSNSSNNFNNFKAHLPIFIIVTLIVISVWHLTERVPEVKKSSSTPLNQFSEERAKDFLRYLLEDIGYRPTGTYNNEFRSVQYIVDVINEIKDSASCKKTSSCPKLEIDIHTTNGASTLKIAGLSIPTKFSNITNILVKISNNHNINRKAILINSHFDSALGAIGATDAGALCAVMVEVIRNILNSNSNEFSLEYPLIFMFNGAEEAGLLGATGFADTHPWAKDITFVLNMDSAGTGAASMFQQNSDRVLRAFKVVPHPHTSSFAVDLFKSGKFPGDTDFRVFRDSLGATGADFGFYKNGYMYHTLIDDMEHLQNGSIQHMGGNLLSLMNELSRSRVLDDPETNNLSSYFDIFGFYLVLLTNTTVRIISVILIITSVVVVVYNPFSQKWDFNIIRLGPALFASIFGLILGVFDGLKALAAGTGFLLFKVHRMSWFTHTGLVIPLFAFPNIFGQILAQFLYHKKFGLRKFPTHNSPPRPMLLDTLRHNSSCASLLIVSIMLYLTMDLGISFYFLISSPCLIAAKLFEYKSGVSGKWNKSLYLFFVSIPTALFLDYAFPLVALLTPVMGRVGMTAPVDLVIAIVTSVFIIFVIPLYLPLLHKTPSFSLLLKIVGGVVILGISVSFFVFPYSVNAPKRVFLQHIADFDNHNHELVAAGWDPIPLPSSFFHDIKEDLSKKGLYQNNKDNKIVFPHFLGSPNQNFDAEPNDWQGFFPYDRRLYGTKFPAVVPEYDNTTVSKPSLTVLYDKYDAAIDKRTLQVQISCNGSNWSNLRINGSLTAWDLPGDLPEPNAAGNYHAKHVVGTGNGVWDLTLTFTSNRSVKLRVAGIYLRPSLLIEQVMDVLPKWMTPTVLTTTTATFIV